MKIRIILALALLIPTAIPAADANAVDQVKKAVAALKEQTNYSWTATVAMPGMPFSPGPMRGQTEKNGFTLITQEFNENQLQAALKGDKAVINFEEQWQLVASTNADEAGPAVMIGQWLTRNTTAAYEAETLLGRAKELKPGEGGLLSSDLTEEGVKSMLAFGPRGAGAPPPKNAKGSVKFWLKDGALTKFESRTQGSVAFGPDQEEREVDITRTVEIQNVGTTKVEVPADAKAKLEAK